MAKRNLINLKKGDIVQLKSGGPNMTVIGIRKDPLTGKMIVDAKWFIGDEPHIHGFVREVLNIVSDAFSGEV